MTKQDFEFIASVLQRTRPDDFNPETDGLWLDIVKQFAFELALKNPRFDKERFVNACLKEVENG